MIEISKSNNLNIKHPSTINLKADCALVFSKFINDTVITKHDIHENKIQKGTPVNISDVMQAMNSQFKEQETFNIIPENVLHDSEDTLIWHSKSKYRPIYFKVSIIISLNAKYPNLLFILNRKKKALNVFALGTSKRPSMNTRLYRAPFMNADHKGLICLGSAVLPKNTRSSNINEIEKCLFESYFTHLNGRTKGKGEIFLCDTKHIAFWRKKHDSKESIKMKELPFYKTLKETLQEQEIHNV